MFLLVAQFDRDADPAALGLLAAQPDCRRLRFGRSTDEAHRYLLVAEFDSVAGYRRTLAPFEVRELVVPWLSTARAGRSGVVEVLVEAEDGAVRHIEPTVPEPGR